MSDRTIEAIYRTRRFYVGDPLADDMGGPPTKVHDWRNHVPTDFAELWPSFSRDVRMALAIVACDLADNEEWE